MFPSSDYSLDLIKNSAVPFTLSFDPSSAYASLILEFQTRFKKISGVTPALVAANSTNTPKETFEILIGDTAYPETAIVKSQLKDNDYFYGVVGNKIVLIGTNASATKKAIESFFSAFLEPSIAKDPENVVFNTKRNALNDSLTYIKSLNIDGNDISKYQIVYSESDNYAAKIFAKRLSAQISQLSGVSLPVVTDSTTASDYEIVVGITKRTLVTGTEKAFTVKILNGKLYILSELSVGYDAVLEYIKDTFLLSERELNLTSAKNAVIPFSTVLTGGSENTLSKGGSIRILVNNIYSGSDNAVLRAKQLAAVYKDYAPDVIGLQEFSGTVKTNINSLILAMGYKEVPYTTKNKNLAVQTPIYYNPNTLKVIDSGYWKYNDNAGDNSKSVAWALFEEISTGKRFIVGSTHFMWTSPSLGATLANDARKIDATEMCALLKPLSEKYNAPVIVGGDFNCPLGSDPINIILNDNNFVEAEDIAIKTERGGTHHAYSEFDASTGVCIKYYEATGNYTTAIDHVFVYDQSKLTVNTFDVVEDYFALASTDHCPIITDITLK